MNRSGHSRPASKLPGTPLKFGRHAYTDLLLADGYALNRGAGGRGGPGMQTQLDASFGTKTAVPTDGVLWIFGFPE